MRWKGSLPTFQTDHYLNSWEQSLDFKTHHNETLLSAIANLQDVSVNCVLHSRLLKRPQQESGNSQEKKLGNYV